MSLDITTNQYDRKQGQFHCLCFVLVASCSASGHLCSKLLAIHTPTQTHWVFPHPLVTQVYSRYLLIATFLKTTLAWGEWDWVDSSRVPINLFFHPITLKCPGRGGTSSLSIHSSAHPRNWNCQLCAEGVQSSPCLIASASTLLTTFLRLSVPPGGPPPSSAPRGGTWKDMQNIFHTPVFLPNFRASSISKSRTTWALIETWRSWRKEGDTGTDTFVDYFFQCISLNFTPSPMKYRSA